MDGAHSRSRDGDGQGADLPAEAAGDDGRPWGHCGDFTTGADGCDVAVTAAPGDQGGNVLAAAIGVAGDGGQLSLGAGGQGRCRCRQIDLIHAGIGHAQTDAVTGDRAHTTGQGCTAVADSTDFAGQVDGGHPYVRTVPDHLVRNILGTVIAIGGDRR
ncbi:hypothetical protein D3C71_1413920 [compost metagenome]